MGGCYQSETLKGETIEEIEKQWNEMVEDDLHENGHSYSGGIGMLGSGFEVQAQTFHTPKEADDFICENHDKWDGAWAVRVRTQEENITLVIGGWCSS